MAKKTKTESLYAEILKKHGAQPGSGASGKEDTAPAEPQSKTMEIYNSVLKNAKERKKNQASVQQSRQRDQDIIRRQLYNERYNALVNKVNQRDYDAKAVEQEAERLRGLHGDFYKDSQGGELLLGLDAISKEARRKQTSSGILPEEAETARGNLSAWKARLEEIDTGLLDQQLDAITRNKQPEEYKNDPEYQRIIAAFEEEETLRNKIAAEEARMNLYDRTDGFRIGLVEPLKSQEGFSTAREDYTKGKQERATDAETQLQQARQELERMTYNKSPSQYQQDPEYQALIARIEDLEVTLEGDALGEYLEWWDSLNDYTREAYLENRLTANRGHDVANTWDDMINSDPNVSEELRNQDTRAARHHWERMTDDEINAYYYIANTEGLGAAKKFLEELQITLDQRNTVNRERIEQERLQENTSTMGAMALGVLTVPENLVAGPAAFLSDVYDKATGKEWNPYNDWHGAQSQVSNIRSAGSEKIWEDIAGDGKSTFWNGVGEVAANAYQAGLSTLDSLAGMVTMGNAYTVSMGMGAASSRMRELYESGATDEEIYIGAIGSGILEALFEKMSLDHFTNSFIQENPEKWIMKMLAQAGVEGSEEVFTEISNQILDAANRGVNSDHSRRVQELMSDPENPMSREEAEKQAVVEDVMDIFWAGFGGALSGGFSSIGGAAMDSARQNRTGMDLMSRNMQGDVIAEAQELRQGNKLAQDLANKQEAGSLGKNEGAFGGIKNSRDATRLGRLLEQNVADMTTRDMEAVRTAVEARLQDSGARVLNPEGTAKAITKHLAGESLGVYDRFLLASNEKVADKVRREIYSAADGTTADNAWVKRIETYGGVAGTSQRETNVEKAGREAMETTVREEFGPYSEMVIGMYRGTQNRADFVAEAKEMYQAGMDGVPLDQAPKTQTLEDWQREMAWDMGQGKSEYAYDNNQGFATIKGEATPVNIVGVESAGDGKLTLRTDEGETVDAKDVTFGSYSQSKLYSVIAAMGVDAKTANEIVTMSNETGLDLNTFSRAMQDAFYAGRQGVPFSDMADDRYAMKLTQEQRKVAWQAGRAAARERAVKKGQRVQQGKHGRAKGGVKLEDSARNIQKLNAQQQAGMNAANVLGAMGLDITVYASTEEQRAKGMENGHIQLSDGSIHIDLNAGDSGEGVMAWALSHEFTHFVEEMSPEKFQSFQEVLFQELGKNNQDVLELIEGKVAVLASQQQYSELSEERLWEIATSEVVAEMMEPMLTDTDAIARISDNLRQQDKGLWEKIKDWLQGLVEKLKNAYKDLTPGSTIAQQTRNIVTQSEEILNAWVDAATDAVVNYNLQDGQKNNTPGGVRFSTRNVNGDDIVWIENSNLTSKQLQDYKAVANYIAQHVGEVYTIIESGMKVYLGDKLPGEYTHSKYTSNLRKHNTSLLRAKNKAFDGIGEMIEIASNRRWEETKHKNSKDAKYGMYRYDSKFAFPVKNSAGEITGVNAYDVELIICNASDGKKYLYDIVNIKKNTANALDLQQREARKGGYKAARQSSIPMNSIPANSQNVNPGGTLNSSRNVRDAEYMAAVESGDMETAQRMVDQAAKEAGYTKLFYHGSKKGGGFTMFRDWQYFTENKAYAKRYTERGKEKSLYTTYVKMEKPFDTRLDDVRQLFEDARMEYGMGQLQENGLPDWTDGYDIADYIDENDLDFDSILLDEGGDLDEHGNPVSRGLSYVIRKSNQIKYADPVTYDDGGNVIPLSQRFDSEAEDIRFSQRSAAQLERENEKLRRDKEYLKELVKIQRTGNKDVVPTRASVNNMAESLKKETGARGSTEELARLLDDFYRYIGKGNLDTVTMDELAGKVADWIQEHQTAKRDPYAQEVLDWMKKRHVSLSQTQVDEIKYQYGSLREFQSAIKGSIIIDQKANTSLDQLWQEGASQFADQFDADMNEGDMPGAFADLVERLRSSEDTETAEARYYREEVHQDLMSQVYDTYFSVKPIDSISDRMQEQIDKLKKEKDADRKKYREALAKSKSETQKQKEENRATLKAMQEIRKAAVESYRKQQSGSDQRMKQLYEKQYRMVMDDYQRQLETMEGSEKTQAKVEGWRKTEERGKLQRTLTTLNKMMLNPTKTAFVPDSLQPAVIHAMEAMNNYRLSEEIDMGKIQELRHELDTLLLDGATKNQKRIQAINKQLDKLQGDYGSVQDSLTELKRMYAELMDANEGKVAQVYDEGVEGFIADAMEAIGDTDYSDLSVKQLQALNDAYAAILHRVRTANNTFAFDQKEAIDQLAKTAAGDLRRLPDREKLSGENVGPLEKFAWNNLKPVYAFERLGSATMTTLYNNLRKGEDVFYQDVVGARAWALECMEEFGYGQWKDQLIEYESVDGKKFSLNLEERMSLYAYSRRRQAIEHLTKGGIVLSENTKRTVKGLLGVRTEKVFHDYNNYRLSLETVQEIGKSLTKEQREFAEKMQEYLSTVCADKNNEISRALYGVSKAKEKYYWPLKASSLFSERVRNQQQNPGNRQKNAGHMKATTPHANNPVEVAGFLETWGNHVNNTAMYHAFTLPMEDFLRVYNFNSTAGVTDESIVQLITKKHGKGATDYIDQFLKDLNSGVRADPRETIASSLTSKFKKGAVSASLSVAIQQPSAVGRAFAVIDPKYFSLADLRYYATSTVKQKAAEKQWEKVKKYAPVAGIKEMGRFDVNMGRSTVDFITGAGETGFLAKLDEISGYLPERMDQATWLMLWNAAERQCKAQGYTGEALNKAAGKLFTECITKTQVYDSVFSRSGNMRSKSLYMNMATAFMAEPTTTANMFMSAMADVKGKDYKAAKRKIGSIAAATVLNALLASLVYAARDDDEDKSYTEKYLKSLTSELVDSANPLGYVPIAKDLWSLLQGYDVDRSDMTLWSEAANTLKRLKSAYDSMAELDEEDDDYEVKLKEAQAKAAQAWGNAAGAICNLFGVPVKNVLREIRAVVNTWETVGEGRNADWETTKYAMWEAFQENLPEVIRTEDSKADQLYKALVSGSDVWVERMKASYTDEKAYDNAVLGALRDYDKRIRAAAKEMSQNADSTQYRKYVRDIVAEGHFSEEQVERAIWAEARAIKGEFTDYSTKTIEKFVDLYEDNLLTAEQFTDFWEYKAAEDDSGKKLHNKDDIIVYIGKMKVNATAKDTLYLKIMKYKEEDLETTPWHSSGYTYWEARVEYPEMADYSDTAVSKFLEIRNSQITVKVFTGVYEYRYAVDDEGKQLHTVEEIMAYIHGLAISRENKDELLAAMGYKGKTLQKAPWN